MKTLTGEKLDKELVRLAQMKEYEKKYGGLVVAGVDEAGRGPLAGPVVAGCVVVDINADILFLNDSKKLSEKKREELYDEIRERALAYGIAEVSEEKIDEINILQATHLAMIEAFNKANEMYKNKYSKDIDVLLIDAEKLDNILVKQESIIKGDAKSVSIAAGSILAKVYRDRKMLEYDKIYSEYGFASHKGYGTKVHMDKLREIGPCPIHRKSFLSFLNS